MEGASGSVKWIENRALNPHSSYTPAGGGSTGFTKKKKVWLYVSLWENDPTSHLIYYLSKQFPHECMVSITSINSFSIQHDVNFLNYHPIKGGYALGCGYFVIDRALPWRVLGFSVKCNQDILPSTTLTSKYSHFWLHKTKMLTAIMPNSRLKNGSTQTNGSHHSCFTLGCYSSQVKDRVWLLLLTSRLGWKDLNNCVHSHAIQILVRHLATQ